MVMKSQKGDGAIANYISSSCIAKGFPEKFLAMSPSATSTESLNSMPQEGRDPGAVTNMLTMPMDFSDPEPTTFSDPEPTELLRAEDRERLQGNNIMGSADTHGFADDELKNEETETGNGGIRIVGGTNIPNSLPQEGRDPGAVTNMLTMPVDFSDYKPKQLVRAQDRERLQGNNIMGSADIHGFAGDELKNEKTETDNGGIRIVGGTNIPNSMPHAGRDPGAITNMLTMPVDFSDYKPTELVRAQDRESLQENSIECSADIHGFVDDELKNEKTEIGNGGIKLFGVTIMPNSMPQGRDPSAVINNLTMPMDFSDPAPTELVRAQDRERLRGNSIMGSADIHGFADDELKNEKTETDNGGIRLFGVTITPNSMPQKRRDLGGVINNLTIPMYFSD